MAAGHFGLGPGLIDENQVVRVEIGLLFEPFLAPLQDVRAILFRRVGGPFCVWCGTPGRSAAACRSRTPATTLVSRDSRPADCYTKIRSAIS
jgi:hypothetical protein